MALLGHKHRRHKKKTPVIWVFIILVIVACLSAVLGWRGGVVGVIERFFSYKDVTYQPRDIERLLPEDWKQQLPEELKKHYK